MVTDIEGSTSLTNRVGDAAAHEIVEARRRVLREALAAHGGQEEDAVGDELMATFPSSRAAVLCATGVQERMAGETEARIRIGLHAGEVVDRDGHAFGAAINGAARVCARAGGGQVLVSEPVRQLAGTVPGVRFKANSRVALKGFDEPWRLFEAIGPAGAPPPPPREPRARRRRSRLPLLAALVCAAGAAALLALLLGGGGDAEAVRFEGSGVGLIDTASNRLTAVVPLSTAPAAIVSDAAGAWVSLPDERAVLRVDGAKRRVVDAVTLGGRPAALAAAGGTVYAQDAERGLLRPLSTAAGAAAPAVRLFRPAALFQSVGTGVAVAEGSVWSAIDGGRVARVDVRTPASARRSRSAAGPTPSPSAPAASGWPTASTTR